MELEPLETKFDTLKLNGITARYNIFSEKEQMQRVLEFSNSLYNALLLLRIEKLEEIINSLKE